MRCGWAKDPLSIDYHDKEWGIPQHDDKKLYEFLVLEGAQAGLSWATILKRRKGYKMAFANFDPKKVANFSQDDVEQLMQNSSIIRNRLKITSAINNAKQFLSVQKEFGSFDRYVWSFVDYVPVKNSFKGLEELPATSKISDLLSADLKRRGFSFVGSTICYSFMQAVGMVNDHLVSCEWKNQ